MDGISAAGAVVGLLTPAIQGTRKLLGIIDHIKDAPEEIRFVRADLKAVVDVLDRMDRYCKADQGLPTGQSAKTLSDTINACRNSCASFQESLNRWLRHSTEDNLFWWDRLRLVVWEKGMIEAFQGRLARYRVTLTMILETDSVMKTWQQDSLSEDMRAQMLQSHRGQVVQNITQAVEDEQKIEERSLEFLQAVPVETSPNDRAAYEELRQVAQREFGFLRDDNRRLQRACEDALKRVEETRTGQKIKDVKASDNSVALTGYINADDDLRVDQDISNVTADGHSLAIAGVAKNIDISSFFPRK